MTTLDVIQVIRDEGLITEPAKLQAIAKALDAAAREAKEERKHSPRGKTRLAILVRGDDALQRALGGGAWVVSVPDDESTATYSGASLISRLRSAAVVHNEAPAKRRSKSRAKITTWQELFTTIKAKTLKDSGSQIGVKQKGNPAEVVVLTSETVEEKP